MMTDAVAFEPVVQEALAHLYDIAFLESCSLATMLGLARRRGNGAELHRLLVETIERLKPPRDVASEAAAWKTYRSLFLRYVRSLPAAAVASELGLSPRQAQRVHGVALRAAATLLQERIDLPPSDAAASEPRVPNVSIGSEAQTTDVGLEDDLTAIVAEGEDVVESLETTLRSAIETLAPVLDRRGVRIDCAMDESLGQQGVSRIAVRQAVVELSLAILDGTRPRRIHLEAEPDPLGARLLFTAFGHDGSEPLIPSAEGLGQRLLVAQRVLAAIGGEVVTSPRESAASPEAGSSLALRLPLHRRRTVLVIEDNAQVIQLFRRYLGGSRYQLVAAEDADGALDLARATRPDVITLDVMMPRRDGWEVLQALKVHPETRNVPVVVCSVLRERELALALGAVEFVAKPVTQRAFLDALNRAERTPSSRGADTPSSG